VKEGDESIALHQFPASLYGCSELGNNAGLTTPGISVQQFFLKLKSAHWNSPLHQ